MNKLIFILLLVFLVGCVQASDSDNTMNSSYCNIIEKTINLPELQQYFHIESFPNRTPLVILVKKVRHKCIELKKFNSPVEILDFSHTKKLKSKPYIEIELMNIDSKTADVNFMYKPEGIKGNIKFTNKNGRWNVVEQRIVEM